MAAPGATPPPADADGRPSAAPPAGAPSRRDDALVACGRVGKPHGLDGTVTVTRPRGAVLKQGVRVLVGDVEREIVRRGGTDERPLLRLEGVDGIAAAEALRGTDIRLPREALPDLGDDEFWPEELVGLPVRSLRGAHVGEVRQVLILPSVDVLEVRRPGGLPDLLVPMHREGMPELDVPARRVVVDLAFLGEDEPGADGSPAPSDGGADAGDGAAGG
ncbi:ribosome maturation factor RimM [Patulibacter sp. SYSU D01012]|uniref:ribosome maturation factor RimM n=1 Tax=Patulibacter sp. SYSU D01012 TaxID=2817381 RepID=UPI001B301DD1